MYFEAVIVFLFVSHVCAHEQTIRKSDLILFTDHLPLEATRLIGSCFKNIPTRVRERCRKSALDKYAKTVYQYKRQCCSRWIQIGCMREYLFNAIYCNTHEQQAVRRFLADIDRISLAPSGDCAHYPPVEKERPFVDAKLGQLPKCVPNGIL
jgi:hypothetical protein